MAAQKCPGRGGGNGKEGQRGLGDEETRGALTARRVPGGRARIRGPLADSETAAEPQSRQNDDSGATGWQRHPSPYRPPCPAPPHHAAAQSLHPTPVKHGNGFPSCVRPAAAPIPASLPPLLPGACLTRRWSWRRSAPSSSACTTTARGPCSVGARGATATCSGGWGCTLRNTPPYGGRDAGGGGKGERGVKEKRSARTGGSRTRWLEGWLEGWLEEWLGYRWRLGWAPGAPVAGAWLCLQRSAVCAARTSLSRCRRQMGPPGRLSRPPLQSPAGRASTAAVPDST
jgi:hypothetical protein